MSLEEFESDLVHFRFGSALHRAEDYVEGTVAPEVGVFVKKLATDEGKMLWASVEAHIGDLDVTSTASYVKVAGEIMADLATKAPSILLQDVFSALNIKAAAV